MMIYMMYGLIAIVAVSLLGVVFRIGMRSTDRVYMDHAYEYMDPIGDLRIRSVSQTDEVKKVPLKFSERLKYEYTQKRMQNG